MLEELGLVRTVEHSGDERRRLVELTSRGRDEAAALIRFNNRLNRVMREILDEAAGDADAFLESLQAIRQSLDSRSIPTRLKMKVDA